MKITEAWKYPAAELFKVLKTSDKGLSDAEAAKRLSKDGANQLVLNAKRTGFSIAFTQFRNPLVVVLLLASAISGFLGDTTGTIIIVVMVLMSAVLGFIQEYRSERALFALRKQVAHRSAVIRSGIVREIDSTELVVGDVVMLRIGDIVPADMRLTHSNDALLNESTLTGESFPVEKTIKPLALRRPPAQDLTNMVFMGTHLVGGSSRGVVVATGGDTELGHLGTAVGNVEEESEFQRGIKHFGNFLVRIIFYFVIFIFTVNAFLKHEIGGSILFALAVAVGVTPEMLPFIFTINLSRAAVVMAREHVIIKRLTSIEDLGNADVLCTDKTGTLTEGMITLAGFENFDHKHDENVLLYSLLCNAAVVGESIEGSPLDTASWKYAREKHSDTRTLPSYEKIDEIMFDFVRRRMSVVMRRASELLMVSKGAPEAILEISTHVMKAGKRIRIQGSRASLERRFNELASQGFRVLAIAERTVPSKKDYTVADETGMTLLGFLMFADHPKKTAREALKTLHHLNVQVKILTGDNALVTAHICKELDFAVSRIVNGSELEGLNDLEMEKIAQEANVFVKITPDHKMAIIKALQRAKHTVAFLGDGINDAPALKAADVGISVEGAVEVAREAADIILLEKSFHVLSVGIRRGRETFGNSMKYIVNTISSNYGNMVSVAGASLVLPFIPLLPTQILLNNMVSDVGSIAIATDRVDPEYIRKPKHWNMKAIRRFMVFFGLLSSMFDLITFFFLFVVFKTHVTLFRTGWFIESSISEIVVLFALRTRRALWKSKPGKLLVMTSTIAFVMTFAAIYVPSLRRIFKFEVPPLWMLGLIAGIVVLYTILAEVGKRYYYKKFEI